MALFNTWRSFNLREEGGSVTSANIFMLSLYGLGAGLTSIHGKVLTAFVIVSISWVGSGLKVLKVSPVEKLSILLGLTIVIWVSNCEALFEDETTTGISGFKCKGLWPQVHTQFWEAAQWFCLLISRLYLLQCWNIMFTEFKNVTDLICECKYNFCNTRKLHTQLNMTHIMSYFHFYYGHTFPTSCFLFHFSNVMLSVSFFTLHTKVYLLRVSLLWHIIAEAKPTILCSYQPEHKRSLWHLVTWNARTSTVNNVKKTDNTDIFVFECISKPKGINLPLEFGKGTLSLHSFKSV